MSLTVLTPASSGATRNAGTNGDFNTLLRWALPQEGWVEEYGGGAGNESVWRAASGNRHRLNVRHDSAISGAAQRVFVRGCEDASSDTAITDPFPLAAQQVDANSNWLVSTTASTVDRPFKLYVTPTWFAYFSQVTSANDEWAFGMFGDAAPAYGADPYGTFIMQRSAATSVIAATTTGIATPGSSTAALPAAAQIYWCRDITGATKSTTGQLFIPAAPSTPHMGGLVPAPAARGGYLNKIYRDKVGVTCQGTTGTTMTSLGLLKRGWVPQLWSPLHAGRGAVNDVDTFADTAYDPTAAFRMLSSGGIATTGACCIIEETDTWSAP